jgi:hypothetical protein
VTSPSPPWLVVQDADRADRIDELTREILDAPPYAMEPGLLDRFVEWLTGRVPDALGSGLADVLGLVVRGVVWVAVAALLLGAAWIVVRRIRPEAFRRGPDGPPPTTTVQRVERSARDWLDHARTARDAGRHRDAVRAAYRAVVVHLVELEAVPATAGATVGAHRAALRRGGVVAELQARGFDRASEVFERVWYADGEADAADVDVVLAAADGLGVGTRGRR